MLLCYVKFPSKIDELCYLEIGADIYTIQSVCNAGSEHKRKNYKIKESLGVYREKINYKIQNLFKKLVNKFMLTCI